MPQFLALETPTPTLESILRILTRARKLITPQKSWSKEAAAYDHDDNETDYLNENAVCWCLTGSLWKELHEELDLPAEAYSKCLVYFEEDTSKVLSKEKLATIILTFRHLVSYVPEPEIPIKANTDLSACHDQLTTYNDYYGTAHIEVLLLLDKAAADIQALLHRQKNLPVHDFKPLIIFTLKGTYGQPDSPLASLPEQASTRITDLFQAISQQMDPAAILLAGDELVIQLYPSLD